MASDPREEAQSHGRFTESDAAPAREPFCPPCKRAGAFFRTHKET